jgi:hypothetical protein
MDPAEKINPPPCTRSPLGNEIKLVFQGSLRQSKEVRFAEESLRQSKEVIVAEESLRQSKEVKQLRPNADLNMTSEDILKPSQIDKKLAMGDTEENLRISKDARET